MTQAKVAEVIGVSRSVVASWEMGTREPNAMELRSLCELFSASSDYLCGRTDNCTSLNMPRSYNIDLTLLNSDGKRILFEFYDFLVSNEAYKN